MLATSVARFGLVALGGAAGSMLRYLARVIFLPTGVGFPWDTLGVNVVGSFAIGLVDVWLADGAPSPGRDALRLFLTTGVMGGLTTYSAFSLQTVQMLRADRMGQACGYVVATTVVCLLVCFLGMRVGRWVSS